MPSPPSDDHPAPPAAEVIDPYSATRLPAFRRYLCGNFIALLGTQMQTVAVGWEIYARSRSALDLGLVGLVQFLPVLCLSLPAGQLADRFDRKRIVLTALAALSLGSFGLAAISHLQLDFRLMYVCLLLNGVAKAVLQPAKSALLPQVVPRTAFGNAVTWNSSGFQLASLAGPAVAGKLIAWFHHVALLYVLEGLSTLIFLVLLLGVAVQPSVRAPIVASWDSLSEGVRFVWRSKIILAAITLDLFAVLLGGATTLLPIYAKDILHVGADGFGWLRAAPAFGALVTSIVLARMPPLERAGRKLLWSVAAFGLAMIVFGFSRLYWLSLLMLFVTGMVDMVSVVIRHTLVQMLTPDEMRGRVSAVNGLFIGASNELGGFESGVVASLFERESDPAFGPTMSVVSGGLGTLLVVGLVAFRWPQVGRYGRLGSESSP